MQLYTDVQHSCDAGRTQFNTPICPPEAMDCLFASNNNSNCLFHINACYFICMYVIFIFGNVLKIKLLA